MTTREKILNSALTLFSKYGYDAASMEQIAELVGIKAPSLYKHFKGKEDILNELIALAEKRYEENFGSDSNPGKIPKSQEEFVRETMKKIRFTLDDEMIKKIRIFLVKEQFRNKRLARVTSMHQLEGLCRMYARIIEGMMEKKLLRQNDASMLALELISPAVLLVAKADREPSSKKEVLDMIEKHLWHFCEVYK